MATEGAGGDPKVRFFRYREHWAALAPTRWRDGVVTPGSTDGAQNAPMSTVDEHRAVLRALEDWEPYLHEHSGLPGPRANLELVEAVADEGDATLLRSLAAREDEFLAMCGVVGLGRLAAAGDQDAVDRLRERASDRRWRVREAVAMALQRVGDADVDRLLALVEDWTDGHPLERRAAAAAVCEPRLLRHPAAAKAALELLDRITASLDVEPQRRSDEVRALRKALGYCWSVAIAAAPETGRTMLEHLAASVDPDIRWIVRENLRKARLRRLDPAWVERLETALQGDRTDTKLSDCANVPVATN